jgi:hypothetical protein
MTTKAASAMIATAALRIARKLKLLWPGITSGDHCAEGPKVMWATHAPFAVGNMYTPSIFELRRPSSHANITPSKYGSWNYTAGQVAPGPRYGSPSSRAPRMSRNGTMSIQ